MDQIKIGKFIAECRKSHELTQEELAEKLGKSRKAVSKWERGVCLPDASSYLELCETLGVTLNEFFAGESLEPLEPTAVIAQSERNLHGIINENWRQRLGFKRLIAILLAILLVIGGVLGWVMNREGYFLGNHIEMLDNNSPEASLAATLADGFPYIYKYEVDEDFTHVKVLVHSFVDGKELKSESEDAIRDEDGNQYILDMNFFGEDYSGILAIVPSADFKEIQIVASNGGARTSSNLRTLEDVPEDGQICFTAHGAGEIKSVAEGKEIPIGIYYVSDKEGEIYAGIAGSYEETVRGIQDSSSRYAYLITVEFCKD